MAKGFKKGIGGASLLNFRIVGGAERPASPENVTVWIETDAEITGWWIGPDEPAEPYAGMVWIRTVQASDMAFNALKKNCMMVCPGSFRQYLDGAFAAKTGLVWVNGAWTGEKFWVFKSGEGLNELFTGFSNAEVTAEKIYKNSLFVDSSKTIACNEKIDVSSYKTAHFDGVSVAIDPGNNANNSSLRLYVGDSETIAHQSTSLTATSISGKDFEVDLSEAEGEVAFGWRCITSSAYGAQFTFSIENIWFE